MSKALLILSLSSILLIVAPHALGQAGDAPPPTQTETTDTGQDPPQDQDEPRPKADLNPLLTDTSLDAQMRQRLSRPAGGISIAPAQGPSIAQVVPNQPADASRYDLADGSDAWAPGVTLRPEGTFLVGWTGEVGRLSTGGLAFLPAIQEEHGIENTGTPEPAMVLLPCITAAHIATILGDQDRGLWLSITGEVLEYHGRNYLLPTAFAHAEMPEEPLEQTDPIASDEAEEQTQPETLSTDQPEPKTNRIDDLVGELEAQRTERRGIDTAFADTLEDQTRAPPSGPRFDGTMLLSQRGRMVRSAMGGWVIAIDNDGEAEEGGLPHHLRLLPCRVVAQMEKQAEIDGENWSFQVSGRLYSYGSTVYLLPRMYITDTRNDIRPLQ